MPEPDSFSSLHGALLIDKPEGPTSFRVIEELQRSLLTSHPSLKKRDLPKLGHGGTLDPFATGLLVVCVGEAVKLARYFLGSAKTYEGVMRFGETTIPGDPTEAVSERSDHLPGSVEEIREMARRMTLQPYLQTPPMHSAKKQGGKPLYELARQGIEVDREPKLCHLYAFDIESYEARRARFRVGCSSGTYVRTLAQDLGRLLGTVGMLDSLRRLQAGAFGVKQAWETTRILSSSTRWDELPCWVPFHRLLDGYDRADASPEEAQALFQGRQEVLLSILQRARKPGLSAYEENTICSRVAIYRAESLIAVANRTQATWSIERVFNVARPATASASAGKP